MWANGATCCECLKHFDRQASWASRFQAKAEAEPALRKVQPLGVSPRGIALAREGHKWVHTTEPSPAQVRRFFLF